MLPATIAGVAARPRAVVGHPRMVIGVWLLLTVGSLAAIVRPSPLGLRIQVDPSSEPLLSRHDPSRADYRRAVLQFGSDDLYVIAMETPDVFTTEALTVLDRVTNEIRRLPGVRQAESLTNAISFRSLPGEDVVEIRSFIENIPTEPDALEDLRRRALADPLYRKTLLSGDARSAAINVTFRPMTDAEFVALDLDGGIQEILEGASGPERHFYVAGRPHVRAQAHHIMVRDLVALIPLAVAVAMLALWLMTGSRRGTLIPLASCLSATIWTYGALALLGRDLNLITLVLGPTLICVGCVYGVHVVSRYQFAARELPDPKAAALRALEYTRVPVIVAGATTCVGFGALTLTDMPATQELGALCVFGVASVTGIALGFVPAVLALLPLERGPEPDDAPGALARLSLAFGAWVQGMLRGIATLTTGRPGLVLAGWALATVVGLAAIPRIEINTDFLTFFDVHSPVRRDFEAVNRLLAGAVPIYVSVEGSEEGRFRRVEALRLVERLQGRLETLPGVDHVLAMTDLVRTVNHAFDTDPTAPARLPDSPEALAEVVFLIPKEKLRRYANANHSAANLVVRTGELGSAPVRRLEGRIIDALAAAPIPPDLRTVVTGNTLLINHSADGIASDQARTVGVAAATILLLILGVFRAVRLALLVMIPNVVPVILFFGTLGALGIPLSIPTSLIGSIILGIAIDDTVHFVVSYQRLRVVGRSPEASVRRALDTVGRPIVFTSVMLCVGFLVITLSGFATLREFGYLTAATMLICLSTDLLLLPALLVRLRA